MKDIIKKWWFWVVIILIVSIGVIVYVYNNHNTAFDDYKKQSITILNQYKAGKLTKKETRDKINTISDKLKNEYKINNETNISSLELNLLIIAHELFDKELSNTEIDTYIQEIKKIN